MSKIYTSFDEVSRAYNKVRRELWNFGVLCDGSKLDGVGCTYLTIAPITALAGYMGLYDPETKEIEFPSERRRTPSTSSATSSGTRWRICIRAR